jgi:hypothetical protein
MSSRPNEEEEKVFGMTPSEWTEYEYLQNQLGVIDNKANNIITVDAVLIVISTLTALFDEAVDTNIRFFSLLATIGILVSVGLCIRTIWTTYLEDIPLKDEELGYIMLRKDKTNYLNAALVALLISLALYLIVLVVGLLNNL